MIAIYSQDRTYIKSSIESAAPVLKELYGEKLGDEAVTKLAKAPIGASYRRNGGPLVQVVDREKAMWIREKEAEIGMM